MTGKVGGKPQPGLHFISLSSRNQKSPNDNDNIYTEDITVQTLKSFISASRRDFCRTQCQLLNMSVISDVSVNCNGLHSAEISQAWQFKSIYCFTDRSPPFNPPKLLDPCAIYCARRPLVRFPNCHECGLGNLTR